MKVLRIFFILISLSISLSWSTAMAGPPFQSGGIFLHLQVGAFDPLQIEPVIPPNLRLTQYAAGQAGPYIVQFQGPVQPGWKDAVTAAGGQIEDYLPDYAFIVRLDEQARIQVEQLDFVRWVGIYQPAYKLSPQLAASPINLYRVRLATWADSNQVRNRLASLGAGVGSGDTTLIVNAEFAQLAQIAQLPDVLWIEAFRFFEKYNDVAAGIMNANTAWTGGYTGAGQTVTIADTGLDTGVDNSGVNGDIHLDFDNRVVQIRSWPLISAPGCIANPGANDGADDVDSGHGTHVAGSAGGNGARSGGLYKGIAHQATLTFQAIEQFTTWTGICAILSANGYYLTGIPDDLNDLFLESYNWGARVHTNSWGSDVFGQYDASSQQTDQFVWNHKDFSLLFAAGNAGVDQPPDGYVNEGSMGSPGTAKNIITIGASENNRNSGGYNPPGGHCSTYGNCWPPDFPANPTSSDPVSNNPAHLAAFSSRGPTDDGRIKPDLVAPGTNILSTRSSQASGDLWGIHNTYYLYSGGTSMATPLAAGAATVVRDYLVDGVGLPTPSAALVKAVLINSAVDISGYGNSSQEAGKPIPNNHEGWGRIDLAAATNSANRVLVDNQSLSTGVTHTFSFTATSSATPLKVSLVWSDYPGNPAAAQQLVNNLNLKLTAPDNAIYNGNNFSNGWSASGGSSDTVNNVENVYIQTPVIGVWSVEIDGANVPQGPQPYALVVYGQGALSSPNTGAGPGGSNTTYLPIIIKPAASSLGPTPGFWESQTGDEFYVTSDSASVDNFAIYVNVPGCGNYKITHNPAEPISNNQFAFGGSFYASGTFNSTTTASGVDGLSNFNISGCGAVNGGPWFWTANWQNSSQPTVRTAEVVGPEMVEPVMVETGKAATIVPLK